MSSTPSDQPCATLSSGYTIPALAFGVGSEWFKGVKGSEPLRVAIGSALDAGFRHIDDAEMYENESDVGYSIQQWLTKTGTPRSALFITSKILSSIEAGIGIEAGCRRTLAKLGLEYLDLYLLHAPFRRADASPLPESLPVLWQQMEALVTAGYVRSIGVSNFRVCDMRAILESRPRIIPAINQVERHPLLAQPCLMAACTSAGTTISAYAPLLPLTKGLCCTPGTATTALSTTLLAVAAAHAVSPAQVLLVWSVQSGVVTITTTSNPARMAEAIATVRTLRLSEDEMAAITAAGAAEAPVRAYWHTLPVDWQQESLV